jgi:hypothetical protein
MTPVVVIDVEERCSAASQFSDEKDWQVIQVAALLLGPAYNAPAAPHGLLFAERAAMLVRAERPIFGNARSVSTDDTRDYGFSPEVVCNTLHLFFSRAKTVVAHGLDHDIAALERLFRSAGRMPISFENVRRICTLEHAANDPSGPRPHDLPTVFRHYCRREHNRHNWHDALADAQACARIYDAMIVDRIIAATGPA